MKVFSRKRPDSFGFYREMWGTMAYTLLIAFSCLGMGATFSFYVYQESGQVAFQYGGYFFMGIGALVLYSCLGYFPKIIKDKGSLVLKLSKDEILLSPSPGGVYANYQWGQINKLVFAEKFKDEQYSETTHANRQLIIYFSHLHFKDEGIIESSKNFRVTGINGQKVSLIPFPKEDISLIIKEMREIAPTSIIIESYFTVIFDRNNKKEIFLEPTSL